MKLTHKKTKGFTLVELLVVIAIIAVLAAFAGPALLNAFKKAKITKAEGICSAFETAVVNFESEYNYLPYGGAGSSPTDDSDNPVLRSDTGEGAELLAVLAGVEDDLNFKKIKFFELSEPKGNSEAAYKDGLKLDEAGGSAQLYDPWGEGYYLILDYGLDGKIDHPFDDDKTISKKAAIYSLGPDMEEGSALLDKDNATNF